jgi:glutamyl-tRNA reductase
MEMLEHQKRIIQNVADDKEIFEKELYKSLVWLENEEIEELVKWLENNYGDSNDEEIKIVLQKVYGQYMKRSGTDQVE